MVIKMASCVECNVKMGYSETNASRNHDGLCIACYVKSLVKTKINAANNTKKPTNARSLDHLFEKFENITLTSETAPNLRIRKRFGIVHGEATFTGTPHEKRKLLDRLRRKKKSVENNSILKNVIEEANVELKANAIKQGANVVVGYNMNLTTTAFGSKNYVIVSVTGTAVETA